MITKIREMVRGVISLIIANKMLVVAASMTYISKVRSEVSIKRVDSKGVMITEKKV